MPVQKYDKLPAQQWSKGSKWDEDLEIIKNDPDRPRRFFLITHDCPPEEAPQIPVAWLRKKYKKYQFIERTVKQEENGKTVEYRGLFCRFIGRVKKRKEDNVD